MNFTIVTTPQDVLNHPLIRGVENIFGISFLDHNDLVKGYPLKDIESISFDEYFARNLFKKIEDDLGFNPDLVTKTAAKAHVERTKVMSNHFGAILDRKPENLMRVLYRARAILHSIFDDFTIFKVVPRYTLGATEHLMRGEDLLTRIKDGGGYQTLKKAFDPVELGWLLSNLPHVEDGRNADQRNYTYFECVSKTAKESRPIGYHEPMVLAVQSGIGDYIQHTLKRCVGIDITTAEEKHRVYAMYYSVYGEYCTMDQSNASQNILRAHCRFLLPSALFDVISKVCPSVLMIDGIQHHHQMMAAQGNGLIFPLQTAIFYALIRACADVKGVETEVLQYGDDSIFKSVLFETVSSVFSNIGMEVNNEKSFFSGPIRESCGGDFVSGVNVRPFYVSKLPTRPHEWYHVCNGIYRVGYANFGNSWRSDAIKRLWLWCLGHIPAGYRYFGPSSYGDEVIHHWDIQRATFNTKGNRIRSLGSVYTSDGRNFGQLSQGLPGSVVHKALANPVFKNSGYRALTDTEKLALSRAGKTVSDKSGKYPSTLGVRSTGIARKWVNYPQSVVKNHDDVLSIFDDLNLDPAVLVARHKDRRDYLLWALRKQLNAVLGLKRAAVSDVVDIQL